MEKLFLAQINVVRFKYIYVLIYNLSTYLSESIISDSKFS